MTLETILAAALFVGLFVAACILISRAPKPPPSDDDDDDDDPFKWGW